jgi:DNA-binding transcriptional regulator GbsR (MarR family)
METIDRQFIEFFRAVGKTYNLDDLTSQIYARLFIDPDEVAMEDLAKETGYSLASISNKIKILESGGMVIRRTRPGTRKVYLYANKDMLRRMASLLVQYQQNEVRLVKSELPRILESLSCKKLGPRERSQVEILKKYHEDTLVFDKLISGLMTKLRPGENTIGASQERNRRK